jgi:superfamily II DNA helicase RecQ
MFYSWADVMAYDRFSDDLAGDLVARQRTQVREMFNFADRGGCRHQAVVRYLGENLGPCGESCDVCSGWDPVAKLPAVKAPRKRDRERDRTPARDFERGERAATTSEEIADEELFVALRKLRKEIADTRGIPAYLVFSDATLRGMAVAHPKSAEELLEVSGVGPVKLEAYGDRFLALLRRY